MPTMIRQMNSANAPSAALSVLKPESYEMEMFAHPNLLRWVEAGNGDNEKFIRCRKSGEVLVPYSVMPTLDSSGAVYTAYNSKPAYVYQAATEPGRLFGYDWLPLASDLTILMVGRGRASANSFVFGTLEGVAGTWPGTALQMYSTGQFAAAFDSLNTSAPAYTNTYAGGPNLMILSWDHTAKKLEWDVNSGLATNARTSGMTDATLEGSTLQIGAAGEDGAGACISGDFSVVQVWSTPLHKAANASLLAAVRSHFSTKYDLPTP